MHHTHLHKYAVRLNLVLTSLLHYTQNFVQSQCSWGIFIIIHVPANNRETSELLEPCLKCILTKLLNKVYNGVFVSKFTCQIKHFGVWSTCFSLKHKASSRFFRFVYLFIFFTSPAKRAPHKSRTNRGTGDSCYNFADYLLCLQGRSWTATPGVSRHFSLIHLHLFLFTRLLGITLTTKIPCKFCVSTFGKNTTTVP